MSSNTKAPSGKLNSSANGLKPGSPIAWPRLRKVLVKSMLGSETAAVPRLERRKATWLASSRAMSANSFCSAGSVKGTGLPPVTVPGVPMLARPDPLTPRL